MDENITDDLRTALNYLRAGRIKDARPIILQVLKTNPEIDQAWYMLSFVVSDRDKQIYALQQVINLNPEHDKAKARLSKVLRGGTSASPTESQPIQPASVASQEAVTLGGSEEQDSLDEQRLGNVEDDVEASKAMGAKPEEKEKKQKKQKKQKKPKKQKKQKTKKPKKAKKKKEEEIATSEEEPSDGMITAGTFGEYEGQKRNWGRPLFVVIAVLVIIGGGYFLFSVGGDVMLRFIDSVNPGSGITVDETESITDETETPDATLTPTGVSGGRQLPATWTPSPAPSSTPTLEPSPTPTPTEVPSS